MLDGTIWYARNSATKDVDYPAVVRERMELGARVDVYPELKDHVAAVLTGRRGR